MRTTVGLLVASSGVGVDRAACIGGESKFLVALLVLPREVSIVVPLAGTVCLATVGLEDVLYMIG